MVYASRSSIRVGRFTIDPKTGELRKDGLAVKLAPQPSKVLVFLAGRAGQIVTRDEIREHIWSSETFVDFDKGLNFCIKQIRTALGDDAETPTYIETLPRRGYRFIAAVEDATANNSEIPLLQNSVDDQPLSPPSGIAKQSYSVANSWVRLSLVAIVLLVCAGYAAFYRSSQTISSTKKDWVLVSQFENRTGESIFDGSVESALQRELSGSHLVNVVPPDRVRDALQRMRRDTTTRLDEKIAREVALRDGNTAAVLTGTVEKMGPTYVLSASVTDPASGILEQSFSEEASDRDTIWPAVHRLAARVRDNIGQQKEVSKSPEVLEKATTTSLRALQFYSKGIAFIDQDKWVEGTEMFRRAIQEDPDFASAHIYLAWCYANTGRNTEAAPHFEKAFALADTTSDRERYFIIGSYYDAVKRDPKQAVEQYEVLIQLYPDDFWGTNNLAEDLSNDLGRRDQAVPYFAKLAEMRPDSLDINFQAWDAVAHGGYDPARAQYFLQRVQALADRSETSLQSPDLWAQLQFMAADEYLRERDPFRATRELDRLSTKADRALGNAHWTFLDGLGNRYVKLGRLHDAERYYSELPEGERHAELAWLADLRGDKETFRKEALAQFVAGAELGPGTAARLAREGLISQAEQVLAGPTISDMLRSAPPESHVSLHVQLARGELAFALGRRQDGLRQMTTAWKSMQHDPDGWPFLGAVFLSDALSKSGSPVAAIQVLQQQLANNPDPMQMDAIAACEAQLKHLYSSIGRVQDAHALEPQIGRQLPLADPDHPLLIDISSITNYPEQ